MSRYVRLTEQLAGLPRRAEKRPELVRRRNALMASLRLEKLKLVREEWNSTQSVDNIGRQIQGRKLALQPTRASLPMGIAQKAVVNALEAPLVADVTAEIQRKTNAISALTAYCDVEEPLGMSNTMLARQRPPPPPEIVQQLSPVDRARELRASVLGKPAEIKRCFVCIAKALTLFPDDPNMASLVRTFYNKQSLSRHFISVHLEPIPFDAADRCPICGVWLYHKEHLQNHADAVHGIRTTMAGKR